MRVLHLHSGNMYGGVETLLATLVREAGAAPGMSSDVALCFPGRLEAELEAASRPPFMLPPMRLSRPHTLLRTRHALRRLLREQAFDAVVCHQPWACVAFGPVVRAAGFPVVLWVHMAGRERRPARSAGPARAARPGDLQQPVHADRASASGCPASRPRWSMARCSRFPAVTDRSRTRVRQALDTPPDDVVVVMASRIEAMEGTPRAARRARADARRARLDVLDRRRGAEPRRGGLRARVAKCGARVRSRAPRSVSPVSAPTCAACWPPPISTASRTPRPRPSVSSFVEALLCGPARRHQRHRRRARNRRPRLRLSAAAGRRSMRSAEALRALDRDGDARGRLGQAARRRPAVVLRSAHRDAAAAAAAGRAAGRRSSCRSRRWRADPMPSALPRLRLAVLSYGLPKRAHKRGGIERAAHTLADGLARRGHDVVVFSHDPRPADAAYAVAPLPWRASSRPGSAAASPWGISATCWRSCPTTASSTRSSRTATACCCRSPASPSCA